MGHPRHFEPPHHRKLRREKVKPRARLPWAAATPRVAFKNKTLVKGLVFEAPGPASAPPMNKLLAVVLLNNVTVL